MNLPKMGMRTIKTGMAVTLCMIIGAYLVQNIFFSAIACVISVQDTVKGSLDAGLNRVKGTILGGIVGFLFVLIKSGNPILAGIGIMVTIYTCNILNTESISVACVTFLAIYLGVGTSNPIWYSIHRVIDTSVGVVFGVGVNYFFARPDYLKNAVCEFKQVEKITTKLIEDKIIRKKSISLDRFRAKIQKLEGIYTKLIDDLYYSRNQADIEKMERIEKTLSICNEIYFHMQSIELLEKKLYINKSNYEELKKLYKYQKINWTIDEEKSPVFNYHLKQILYELKVLNNLNKTYK